MLLKLILLLTAVPLVELYLLFKYTMWTSFGVMILTVIATGIIGAALARQQGLAVLRQIQEDLRSGGLPGRSLLDGALVLVAGALLLTPGLLTDAVGFLLLIPPTRALVRKLLTSWFKKQQQRGRFQVNYRPLHDEPPPGYPPVDEDAD